MARARLIKPEFFHDEDLVELAPLTRLLFIGLWGIADREGRLEDRPKRIKMQVLPADQCDVDEMLDELAAAGAVRRYELDGERYIWIPGFGRHQNPHPKERESAIPAHVDDAGSDSTASGDAPRPEPDPAMEDHWQAGCEPWNYEASLAVAVAGSSGSSVAVADHGSDSGRSSGGPAREAAAGPSQELKDRWNQAKGRQPTAHEQRWLASKLEAGVPHDDLVWAVGELTPEVDRPLAYLDSVLARLSGPSPGEQLEMPIVASVVASEVADRDVAAWQRVASQLEAEVARQCYSTWIAPLVPAGRDAEGRLVLQVSRQGYGRVAGDLAHTISRAAGACDEPPPTFAVEAAS